MTNRQRDLWVSAVSQALCDCVKPITEEPDHEQQVFYFLWLEELGYKIWDS